MHQPDLQGGAGAVHIEPDLKVCSQWLMRPRLSLTGGLLFNWAMGQDTLRGGATRRLVLPMSGYSSRARHASYHGCWDLYVALRQRMRTRAAGPLSPSPYYKLHIYADIVLDSQPVANFTTSSLVLWACTVFHNLLSLFICRFIMAIVPRSAHIPRWCFINPGQWRHAVIHCRTFVLHS